MQSNNKFFFIKTIIVIWLTLCLTLFVYVSRIGFVQIVNITNWQAFREMLNHISPWYFMLDLLRAFAGVIVFSICCLSFGLFILKRMVSAQGSLLALGVTAFLVGEISFSVIFLTLISLFRLTPTYTAIIISIGFLVGIPAIKIFITSVKTNKKNSVQLNYFEKTILALIIFSLLLGLSLSFTRLGYDATAYYFSHAKIMAVSHMPVFFHPNDAIVVSSFHPGILFTGVIQLFGDHSARMLSWINGVAILLLGLAIGHELNFTTREAFWFLILMVSTTAFMDLLGDGKIELISTAPILAAIYWILHSAKNPTRGIFILTGLLSGFAIISRPYNLFLVSVFMAVFVTIQALIQYRTGRFEVKSFLYMLLWISLPVLALGTFHLFQNWIWLKNPIAPLVYAKKLDSSEWQWQFNPEELNLYRLLYPITLTYMNSAQSLGNISPLLIGLLPILFFKSIWRQLHIDEHLKWLVIASIPTLLAWIILSFTVVEIRYVLFLWIILFIAAAPILDKASQFLGRYGHLLIVLFLSVLCIRTILISVISYFPVNSANSPYCADNYLCKFMEILNRSAAPGDRVLVLHAYRYYLRPDLFACSSRVDEYAVLESLASKNSPDFWVEAYRQGFRFIIYEKHLAEARYQFGKLPNPNTAPAWMDVKILYSNINGTQKIYKLETRNPPVPTQISCIQNSSGMWQIVLQSTP